MNGSHITAMYDGTSTDYVFMQSSDGIQRASVDLKHNTMSGFNQLLNGTNSAGIQAWNIPNHGPMPVVTYSNGDIVVSTYDYDGTLVYNTTVA